MSNESTEVTRKDRIYCLKASSDYHSELCEECRFYPNCDHTMQDDLTEMTIKDLEALELESESCDVPKIKTAHWIKVDKDKCKCDNCEVISFIAMYPNGNINYCPNCGRRMIEHNESGFKHE